MRTILVDWLIEVADEYKMTDETLFLSVQYVDRFLSTVNVTRSKLQLLGTTCLYLASKYEEMYPPALDEFSFITDNTYEQKHILRMEQIVIKVSWSPKTSIECSSRDFFFPARSHIVVLLFLRRCWTSLCRDPPVTHFCNTIWPVWSRSITIINVFECSLIISVHSPFSTIDPSPPTVHRSSLLVVFCLPLVC